MTATNIPFQSAGSIDIQEVVIFTDEGKFLDVKDFIAELNIYEDLYAPFLQGVFILADSRNLVKEFPIVGEEYFYIKMKTPNTDSFIEKMFRIYSVTDREVVKDRNTQIYNLNFISVEAVVNTFKPIFKTFEGQISEIVKTIFDDYIQVKRAPIKNNNKFEFTDNETKLNVLSDTSNSVKFVSPGWTPFKCINWCVSKSIPKIGKACNFVFYESNKSFNYVNLETIFRYNTETKGGLSIGNYVYNVNQLDKNKNPISKLFNVEEFQILKNVDHLTNYDNGYLANRLITLDVINKVYRASDYDAVKEYNNYKHMEESPRPIFARNPVRTSLTNIKFAPVHPGLFENFKNNVNESYHESYGNRKSNMMELQNLKLNLVVPGRTDVEVGTMLNFIFPDISPKSEKDKSLPAGDKYYSGNYLITAIRHKINLQTHFMSMEVTKDSLKQADET